MLRATAASSAASPSAMAELVAAARMRVIEAGEYLFRHGDPSDAVYVIVEGLLAEDVDEPLVCLGPGELVGEMQIMFGGVRSGDVRASCLTELILVPRAAILRALDKEPTSLDVLVGIVRRRLECNQAHKALLRLFGACDERAVREMAPRAEWLHLPRGELLVREGDAADCLYVLVSGRLQAFSRDGRGEETIYGKIGPGETVGEMALVSNQVRSASVRALRDCELARFGRDLVAEVALRHPQISLSIGPRLRSAPGDSQRRVRILHDAPARSLTAARGRLRRTLCNPSLHTILTRRTRT